MKINARIPKKGLSLVSSKGKPGQPFGKHGHSFRKLAHPFGKQAHPFGKPDPHSEADGEVPFFGFQTVWGIKSDNCAKMVSHMICQSVAICR